VKQTGDNYVSEADRVAAYEMIGDVFSEAVEEIAQA
jgi:hypothetical protein